jgi:pimeloyl-ACP methyl ester carboxylesterase
MSDSAPTVVLVHGAFADASSFARVIPELLADEVPVVAPAVPDRSLAGDAAYIASVVGQIDGPVVLVGHSYGGAVITVAGVEDNVKALVYLAGYALGEGVSLGELQGRFPDSDLAAALVTKPSPPKARSPAPTCTWTSRSSPRSSLLTSTRTSRRSSRCPSAHSPQGVRRARLRGGVEVPALVGVGVLVGPHHQPGRRAVRLPAGGSDDGRDRLVAHGDALPPQAGRRPDRGGAARRGFVTAADQDGSPLRSPASSCGPPRRRCRSASTPSPWRACWCPACQGTPDDQLRHLPTEAGVRRTL